MDAQTLREVMGGTLPDGGYSRLIDGYNNAMRAAGITNVQRAAMFAAQLGHESEGLLYMREIADGSAYEWRADLGNVHAGDGKRYRGRGPIQLTGRANYRAFTRWAREHGHSDIDFEASPELLEEPHWGFLAAAYYWTWARPQINALCDAGDLEGVTRAINGGLNGIADRRARYQRALQFGERLLPDAVAATVCHPMGEPGAWSQSSGYGQRWGTMHAGLDFAADLGTPIYAVADGTVVEGADRAPGTVTGFGNWVWLDCQATVGRDFIYGHMAHQDIYVSAGDRVKAGQLIARVGSEGQSTGPHLHFEVWGAPGRLGGQHEDPEPWLTNHLTVPKEDTDMNLFQMIADFIKGFVGPIGLDVKAVRWQLTGGANEGEFPGFKAEHLLKNVRAKGYDGLTLVDMIALQIWGTEQDRAAARAVGEKVK